MAKNPYFIDRGDDSRLTREQSKYMKENWTFVTTILTNIMKENGGVEAIKGAPNYLTRILSGTLMHSDKLTGVNSRRLGEKIRFLVTYLDASDKNKERFMNTFFAQSLFSLLYNGPCDNNAELWTSYKRYSDLDPELAGKKALSAAVYCYRNDPTVPVGLNYITLIDALVKENKDGSFSITDGNEFSLATKTQMTNAVNAQIRMLKAIPRFKQSYSNGDIETILY